MVFLNTAQKIFDPVAVAPDIDLEKLGMEAVDRDFFQGGLRVATQYIDQPLFFRRFIDRHGPGRRDDLQ